MNVFAACLLLVCYLLNTRLLFVYYLRNNGLSNTTASNDATTKKRDTMPRSYAQITVLR